MKRSRKMIGIHATLEFVEQIDQHIRKGQPGQAGYFASRTAFIQAALHSFIEEQTKELNLITSRPPSIEATCALSEPPSSTIDEAFSNITGDDVLFSSPDFPPYLSIIDKIGSGKNAAKLTASYVQLIGLLEEELPVATQYTRSHLITLADLMSIRHLRENNEEAVDAVSRLFTRSAVRQAVLTTLYLGLIGVRGLEAAKPASK